MKTVKSNVRMSLMSTQEDRKKIDLGGRFKFGKAPFIKPGAIEAKVPNYCKHEGYLLLGGFLGRHVAEFCT
jgi:hypothetical protein